MPVGDHTDRIDILITGGDQFELNAVQDKGEGRYGVDFSVKDQANWSVDVLVDGIPIQASPFTPVFDAAMTDPSKCNVLGECFEQDVEAGSMWKMILIAKVPLIILYLHPSVPLIILYLHPSVPLIILYLHPSTLMSKD